MLRLVFLVPILLGLCSCDGENVASVAASQPTVVPIRMVDDDPIIEIRVNGTPIDVHFDIGNGTSLALFPSRLDQIDKIKVGTSAGGISMDGPTDSGKPIYKVSLIQIGELRIADANVEEDFHDAEFQADFSSQLDAYGFMGRGLLEEYKVVIDYNQQELTILPPDFPENQNSACTGREVPLVQGQTWGLVSNAETDIGEMVVVWDTGAPFSVVFKKWTDSRKIEFTEGDALASEDFILGGHQFGPTELQVLDWGDMPPFDGFIGYDFFAKHVVCIDFPENRIFVKE